MSQTNPGGTHYRELLDVYERNLRIAESKGNKNEIALWKDRIRGLKQEAANRGIRL